MIRCLLIGLALVAGAAGAEDKTAGELDGTYELREFIENGRASDERRDVLSIIIREGTMTVKTMLREDVARITLDSAKTPHQIDFKAPSGQTKVVPGIWKVEKGELTVIFSKTGARPVDFKASGDGVVKFVMVKATGPKKDK